MRLLRIVVVFFTGAALLVGLAGCANATGALTGTATVSRLACKVVDDYSVVVLTATVRNTGREPVTVTRVTGLRLNNLRVLGVRLGRAGAALADVETDQRMFYTPHLQPVTGRGVKIPAGTTYQLVALAQVRNGAGAGTLSAFEIDYHAGFQPFSMVSMVGYKLSSRLNGCESAVS